jgi:hypothetical protein
VLDLVGPNPDTVARLSVALVGVALVFFLVLIHAAGRRWNSPHTPPGAQPPATPRNTP